MKKRRERRKETAKATRLKGAVEAVSGGFTSRSFLSHTSQHPPRQLLTSYSVPIFNYLIGIAASLFASWYTYGIAGFFWLYDAYHFGLGKRAFTASPVMTSLCVLTILSGAFICVAGMYVSVDSIISAYSSGTVTAPFSC